MTRLTEYKTLCGLLGFMTLGLVLTYGQTLEDAQITYRYALRYAEGYPWGTWNRLEAPIEGFTTILWMFVISLFGPSLDSIAHASKIFGGFSAFGLVALYFSVAIKSEKNQLLYLTNSHAIKNASICTSIFCTVSSPIIWYATSGMETVTFIFLINFVLFAPAINFNILGYAFLCISLVAIRPEGVMFAAAAALFYGIRDRRYLAVLVLVIVSVSIIFLCRYIYFGELMPNTYFAKSGGAEFNHLKSGVLYFGSFLVSYWFVFLPFLAIPYLLLSNKLKYKDNDFYFLSILGVLIYGVIIARSGGDNFSAFPHWRHGLVVLPLAAFLSFYTLFKLELKNAGRFASFICCCNLIIPIGFVVPTSQSMWAYYSGGQFSFQNEILKNPMFLWLKDKNRSDITIATSLAGELPLTVDFNHIDILGLNDKVIAHEGRFDPNGPVDSKTKMSYVISRKPEIIEAYVQPQCVINGNKGCVLKARRMMTEELFSNVTFSAEYLLITNAPYEYFNRAIFVRRDYYADYARFAGIEASEWVNPVVQL
jgi:hypothetical protein